MYLWTLPTNGPTDAATANRLQEFLSVQERNEARRFRRVREQQQFVMARALVRLALSRHFPIPSDDWRFDRDRNGRPFIAAPMTPPPVRFSVSHTEGLIACLITLSAEAAVDVEKVEHDQDLAPVAREVLSLAEQSALSRLTGKDWTARFFDHWTLKEAYAKARGLGLSLTLSDIGFDLNPDNSIGVHFSSRVDDNSAAWEFWCRHLSPQHTASVAAKKECGERFEIILRTVQFDGATIAFET